MNILGFIGVGDLAEYTIKGLRGGGYRDTILLGPRNQQRARMLADIYQCEVMDSNQAVADVCDQLVLSTRPAITLEVCEQLELQSDQEIISVVAGLSIDDLSSVTGNNGSITRAMPVNCAEVGASPTIVYPFNAKVLDLFNHCGKAIPVGSESAFDQANVLACVYTWYFELFESLVEATTSNDLPAELAKELVLGMANGAASYAQSDKSRSPGEITDFIATEGTFSKLGLELLREKQAFDPWRDACQLLLGKLTQKD